jgi:hypothetical protein
MLWPRHCRGLFESWIVDDSIEFWIAIGELANRTKREFHHDAISGTCEKPGHAIDFQAIESQLNVVDRIAHLLVLRACHHLLPVADNADTFSKPGVGASSKRMDPATKIAVHGQISASTHSATPAFPMRMDCRRITISVRAAIVT